MHTVVTVLIVALIACGCIFGKQFWEKRYETLGIFSALLLVVLLAVTFSVRRSLPIERTAKYNGDVYSFYVMDTVLQKDKSYPIVLPKYTKWNMYEDDASYYDKKVVTTRTTVGKDTYKYSFRFAKQTPAYFLFYYDGSDTLIGFIRYSKDADKKITDYYTLGNVKFSPLTKDFDKPCLVFYSDSRVSSSKWVIQDLIPNVHDEYCLYLPKQYYDKLPEHIKSKYSYSVPPNYLVANSSK